MLKRANSIIYGIVFSVVVRVLFDLFITKKIQSYVVSHRNTNKRTTGSLNMGNHNVRESIRLTAVNSTRERNWQIVRVETTQIRNTLTWANWMNSFNSHRRPSPKRRGVCRTASSKKNCPPTCLKNNAAVHLDQPTLTVVVFCVCWLIFSKIPFNWLSPSYKNQENLRHNMKKEKYYTTYFGSNLTSLRHLYQHALHGFRLFWFGQWNGVHWNKDSIFKCWYCLVWAVRSIYI